MRQNDTILEEDATKTQCPVFCYYPVLSNSTKMVLFYQDAILSILGRIAKWSNAKMGML